jgi:hypothetical protein
VGTFSIFAICSRNWHRSILSRYANRAARFISAYSQGLSGPEAVWANRKYHGHRILPPSMMAELKREFADKSGTKS